MKKFKFLAIFIIITIFAGIMPVVNAEEYIERIIDTNPVTDGSFGGSGLKGFEGTSSIYDSEDDSATAKFVPFIFTVPSFEITKVTCYLVFLRNY